MPAIVFFGRSWNFASDDLVIPSIIDAILRIILILILGIPLATIGPLSTCIPATTDAVFCLGIIAYNVVMTVLSCVLAYLSSKGGVMEEHLRARVPPLFVSYLLLTLLELPIYCVDIYFATRFSNSCPSPVYSAFLTGCSLGLIKCVIFFVLLASQYQTAGRFWGHDGRHCSSTHGVIPSDAKSETVFKAYEAASRRCKKSLSLISGLRRSRCGNEASPESEETAALETAAELFAELFFDVNLVSSDIITGLFLLRWQTTQWVGCGRCVPQDVIQRSTVESFVPTLNQHVPTETGQNEPGGDSADSFTWLHFERIWRLSHLAISAYGFLFYCLRYRLSPMALCNLCRHLHCNCNGCVCRPCCDSSGDDEAQIGCCLCTGHNCDVATVFEATGLQPDKFICIHFDNAVFILPHFVAIDDESQCIVIAIRGTMSFTDAVVDLLYDGVRLDESEIQSEMSSPSGRSRPVYVAHRGMVASSRRLRDHLLGDGVIQQARTARPNYPLVVCGHSLGAGVASILTLLLRPSYPEVKGYAFSPPFGLMNTALANYAKSCLCSVVLGYDLISRMSKVTIEDLKWRLIDALTACRVPKYRLLCRSFNLSIRRCFTKYCSPCCYPAAAPVTIGRDIHLLDEEVRARLLQPKPPVDSFQPTKTTGIQAGDTPNGIASRSIQSTDQLSSRLITGHRSLISWINPTHPNLLRTPSTHRDRAADYRSTMGVASGSNVVSSVSTVTAPSSDEQEGSYELADDAIFGGFVLHLVETTDEEIEIMPKIHEPSSDNADGEHRSRRNSLSASMSAAEAGDHPRDATQENRLLLSTYKNTDSKRIRCGCKARPVRPPVAIWTDATQFRCLLVHPRMFLDHFPDQMLDAMDRLRAAIRAQSGEQLQTNNQQDSTPSQQVRYRPQSSTPLIRQIHSQYP